MKSSWLKFSRSNNSVEVTTLTSRLKMSVSRGPKRKAIEAEMEEKRRKVEEAKVEMVKQEKDENMTGYSCPLCSMELNCSPGDRVMKRHIMDEHFTPGSLLEMVGLDLEEGQKLR